MTAVEASLQRLYAEIHSFAAARDRGSTPLVERKAVGRALDGDILLLAQGLARGTQRVTGYPYRTPDGLSPAGRRLDRFLETLNYTIDHEMIERTYAYSTDLVPWYPGRHPRGKGDLLPAPEDIEACWHWFERETDLLQPKAVILLGKWAADRFLRRYGSETLVGRLEDVAGRRYAASIAGCDVVAAAAFHPSAVWGKFESVGRESWRGSIEALRSELT